MAQSTPNAPPGLARSGRKLWREITTHLELDQHEVQLLVEACRCADNLDQLAEAVKRDGVLVDGKAHPALIESRQQRITLTRLIASLRLPADLQNPEDARRPQRRGAARGSYLRSVS